MDLSRASLNSITARAATYDRLLGLAVEQGFGGVGLWRDVYRDIGASAAGQRAADAGLRVTSVCRGGMFTHSDRRQEAAAWDENRRAVEETRDLSADCLVLVCGGADDLGLERARAQIAEGVDRLAEFAAECGVRLAIEPMHPMMVADRSAIASLAEANDLIDSLGRDDVGVALDAYHVFWDVQLEREIRRAAGRMYCVQVSDWVLPIPAPLSSRGMPGEGTIDLSRFVGLAGAAGYVGLVEVEVLSDRWWAQSARSCVDAARAGVLEI